MTLAVGDATITADHARSAMRAGATLADLHGVCETAAVVLGMPGYTRGIAALHEAMTEQRLGDRPSSPAAAESSKRPTNVRSTRPRSADRLLSGIDPMSVVRGNVVSVTVMYVGSQNNNKT